MSSTDFNGIPGQMVTGYTPLYLSSGVVPAGTKSAKFLATVTSAADGTWSCDISAAGFPNVALVVGLAPISTDGSASSLFFPLVTNQTTTLISGTIMQPQATILGLIPVAAAKKAFTFNMLVIGW